MDSNKAFVYPGVFHKNSDGSYTVTFPDLPGCISEGKSLKGAISDEAPNCFYVKANGVEWWHDKFAGSNSSGPVSRLNNGNPANFVKVTPGKTYNIVFSGHHGYKGRNYGLRFFWGSQINSYNYSVRVNGDG